MASRLLSNTEQYDFLENCSSHDGSFDDENGGVVPPSSPFTVSYCSDDNSHLLSNRLFKENDHNANGESLSRKHKTAKSRVAISKAAAIAKQNRMRKKALMEAMRADLAQLTKTNEQLSSHVRKQNSMLKSLCAEIEYLRNLQANSRDIVKVMNRINAGIQDHHGGDDRDKADFLSSLQFDCGDIDTGLFQEELGDIAFEQIEEASDATDDISAPAATWEEHNYVKATTDNQNLNENAGMCLHVSKSKVSLRLCSLCSNGTAHY